jgi:hypothetical protein
MGQLVKVFKPDPSAVWVFKAMVVFGLLVAAVGFATQRAMASCFGLFLVALFAALTFKQSGQSITIYDDKVVFNYAGQEGWTLPFESFAGVELTTTWKQASKYSPGRTILLRFLDNDDKLCAEANVNVFDKNAIRAMIELIHANKPSLGLNAAAQTLLQDPRTKGSTIETITKTE